MIIDIFDLLLTPLYLLVIYFIAAYYQRNQEIKNKVYKYYLKGLFVKLFGAIMLCMIYQFYYGGGDTTNYFVTAKAILSLAGKNFNVFSEIMLGNNSVELYSAFDNNTGYPVYWRDPKALFVARLIVPFVFFGCKCFVITAILMAWLCYAGVWKLYLLFTNQFPKLSKEMAISILFIPSVIFWGSGILKDTITLSAVGWYTYEFYYFFIAKKYSFGRAGKIFFSIYLLISIKPYIFFALLPGSMVWLSNANANRISSTILRVFFTPIFITLGIMLSVFILTNMKEYLGLYAIDKVMDRAVEVNIDQKQEYYGGNSFNIGDFDASTASMLSKAHLAIAATFFRPYLWDARNPVMLISALENTYLLLLTIFLLVRLKVVGFFALIGGNPLLLFAVLFALFFGFSVGIATSNFGSLVRLKIPCIPFFVSSLFVLKYFYEEKRYEQKHRITLKKTKYQKV
jgi:hypothetical protein